MIRDNYHHIDMIKTGMLLKDKILLAGYSVKEIQEELHLSCPQLIYRWFKGRVLPSLDYLYVLSRLLKVHMEELIVPETPWDGRERMLQDWTSSPMQDAGKYDILLSESKGCMTGDE